MNLRHTTVLVAIALGVSACSSVSPGGTDDTDGTLPSPAEAMERAGLTMPKGATGAEISTKELPDRRHAWAVTFTAPRSEALAVCEPLGGAGHQSFVPKMHRKLLGDLPTSEASRGCNASTGDGGLWGRFVLIDPGDPATVHISLQNLTR